MAFRILFLIANTFIGSVMSSFLATVCPASQRSNSNMRLLYENVICSNFNTSKCTKIDTPALGFTYAGFLILLHNGDDWERLAEISWRLSECGIAYTLIDGSRMDEFRKSNVLLCPRGAATVVWDIGFGDVYFNESIALTETDCAATYISIDHPLSAFKSACPNTIWWSGNSNRLCEPSESDPPKLVHVNAPVQNTSRTIKFNPYDPPDQFLLRDKVLRIATIANGPFVRMNDTNGTTTYTGIVFEILDRLARNLSFRYTIMEPLDGQYGILKNDGNFTGLVGMLQRKEVDLIAADLTVAYNRSLVIDFMPTAYYFESIGIMINEPKSSKPLWKWTSPFNYKVWLILFAATVIVSSILYLTHVHHCVYVGWRFAYINDCLWHVGTGLLGQGLDFSPVSWWGQTLLSFWWLLCLAVIAAYSGNLVAMLTTDKLELPFNTFEELAQLVANKEYRVCVQQGTSFYDELMKGTSESYIPIRKYLQENPEYTKPKTLDCIQMMTNEVKLAVLQEVNQLEDFQRSWCKNHTFIILNDRFYASYFSFAFQKGSPFMAAFAVPMLETVESGLISIWKEKYTMKPVMCQIMEPNSYVRAAMKALEFDDFMGVILTFGIGVGFGLVMLLFERLRNRPKSGRFSCFGSLYWKKSIKLKKIAWIDHT